MNAMREAAEDYIALRRAMGFKLEKPGRLVLQFADHLDQLGTRQITIGAALACARQPAQADPSWWAYRLSAVRGFAAYLHPRVPGIQVPPADLLPLRTKRATPYLYSGQDIDALMNAARTLRTPRVAATYETLIGTTAPRRAAARIRRARTVERNIKRLGARGGPDRSGRRLWPQLLMVHLRHVPGDVFRDRVDRL